MYIIVYNDFFYNEMELGDGVIYIYKLDPNILNLNILI